MHPGTCDILILRVLIEDYSSLVQCSVFPVPNWIQPDDDTYPPYSVLGHMLASEWTETGQK
jgi:hypothetical protein